MKNPGFFPSPSSPTGAHEVGNKSPLSSQGKSRPAAGASPADAGAGAGGRGRSAAGPGRSPRENAGGCGRAADPCLPEPPSAHGAPSFHGARKVRPAGAERAAPAARRGTAAGLPRHLLPAPSPAEPPWLCPLPPRRIHPGGSQIRPGGMRTPGLCGLRRGRAGLLVERHNNKCVAEPARKEWG